MNEHKYCKKCTSWLRSSERDKGVCDVCFYHPREEDQCADCGCELTAYERQLDDEYTGLCGVCVSRLDEPEDEQDFLDGKTCNPNAPEECESCQ